jgi:hypothetical protein
MTWAKKLQWAALRVFSYSEQTYSFATGATYSLKLFK